MSTNKLLIATGVLMFLNSLAMCGMLFIGIAAWEEIDAGTAQLTPITSFLKDPTSESSQPILHELTSTTGEFLLGPVQGSVGYLLDSIFRTDFGMMGNHLAWFANNGTRALTMTPPCDPNTSDICVGPYMQMVFNFLSSVGNRLKLVGAITNPYPTGAVAFDGGMMGLNGLLRWVDAQTNSTAWGTAGVTCKGFKSAVRAVNWTGSFWDMNDGGSMQSFDWNDAINQTFADGGFIDQICDSMSHMGS